MTEMEEVIVNGMFTQNRNSYTGSVTTMKGEDILAVSNTNLLKAISVLSPGLRLVENNEMGFESELYSGNYYSRNNFYC